MVTPTREDRAVSDDQVKPRRRFVERASRLAMLVGLTGGYGGFGLVVARYLYPSRADESTWQFVSEADRMRRGDSVEYQSPAGERINIARQSDGGRVEDFTALSSICPHLGCQVHWEAQNDRFFCPCHNGVFDPTGEGVSGPPADAGQSLARYPLRIENGLLFIQVSRNSLPLSSASGQKQSSRGDG